MLIRFGGQGYKLLRYKLLRYAERVGLNMLCFETRSVFLGLFWERNGKTTKSFVFNLIKIDLMEKNQKKKSNHREYREASNSRVSILGIVHRPSTLINYQWGWE